jgi:hypothetical protein
LAIRPPSLRRIQVASAPSLSLSSRRRARTDALGIRSPRYAQVQIDPMRRPSPRSKRGVPAFAGTAVVEQTTNSRAVPAKAGTYFRHGSGFRRCSRATARQVSAAPTRPTGSPYHPNARGRCARTPRRPPDFPPYKRRSFACPPARSAPDSRALRRRTRRAERRRK